MIEERRDARWPAGGLAALAREIREMARAEAAFGAPIRHGEITLIPVARTGWGIGGGFGEGRRGGAGGGAGVRPLGYIAVDAAGVRFCPIPSPWTPARAAVVGLAIGVWLGRRRGRR